MVLTTPTRQALRGWVSAQVRQELNPDYASNPAVQARVTQVIRVLKALQDTRLPWPAATQQRVLDYILRVAGL